MVQQVTNPQMFFLVNLGDRVNDFVHSFCCSLKLCHLKCFARFRDVFVTGSCSWGHSVRERETIPILPNIPLQET